MSERFTLMTSDGATLEARIDSPASPRAVTVFCHPHPLHGGSMLAPLMIGVTIRLVEKGFAVIRFNFRGVGNSTGHHDGGIGEQLDISAAVEHAKSLELPLTLAGWSFGAATALRWMETTQAGPAYVGIAPPAGDLPTNLPPGPKRIVLGTRDQVVDGAAVRAYAVLHSIDLVLTPGDHFFHGRGKKIGDLVAEGLA